MKRLSAKHVALLKSAGIAVLVLVLVFLFVTKLFKFVAPFVIALIIASIIENPIRFLQKRLKFPRGIAVGVVLILFAAGLGALVSFVFYRLVIEVWNLAKDSPGLQAFFNYVVALLEEGKDLYNKLPDEIVNNIESNINNIVNSIKDTFFALLNGLMQFLKGVLVSLPQYILYIFITLVSTFFLSKDREKISRFVFGQLPYSWRQKIRNIKNDLLSALLGFIKAQAFLITVTFIWVLIGYSLIRVEYVFLLAVFTAIFDILPVLGPGSVIIPTAIVYGVIGDGTKAFWLVVLYITVVMLRQFLEPRVIGGGIGLHPLMTLIVMYIGLQIFGIFGLILGPIIAIVIKSLQKAGILPKWRESEGSDKQLA